MRRPRKVKPIFHSFDATKKHQKDWVEFFIWHPQNISTLIKVVILFRCPTQTSNLEWILLNEFPFPGNLLRCLARRNKKRFPPNSQSIYHKWQKKLRAFRDQSLMSMKRVGMLTCSAAIRVGQNISKSYASIFYCKKGFRPTVSMFMDHKWQKKLRV